MNDDDKLFNQTLDRSEEILTVLGDSFEAMDDDLRAKKIYARYTQAQQAGTVMETRLGTTYLEWALNYPRRVASVAPLKSCRCDEGFVLDDPETDRWRPCERCLPSTYDKWSGNSIGSDEDFDGS